jgi:hypothetical protein
MASICPLRTLLRIFAIGLGVGAPEVMGYAPGGQRALRTWVTKTDAAASPTFLAINL